jgi:hypothetical protein
MNEDYTIDLDDYARTLAPSRVYTFLDDQLLTPGEA